MKKKKTAITLIILCCIVLITAAFFHFRRDAGNSSYIEYHFRNAQLLSEHYDKHGKEMGFASKEDYEKAASDVANDSSALHKKEKEDNDDVYYLVETNEIVIISYDGYIRTFFCPDSGISYFNRQ